ncbi:hypothetical protein [Sphingobacterium siyangense]|uniref:hypothetical protein n=1 Tax=Sphingobacterium siyangense TaxID=459529 RepID=UPI0031F8C4D5
MIHPELTSDPIHMQGRFGAINHVLYEDWSSYVLFQNQMLGLYTNDALLMLVPPEILVEKLRKDIYELDMDPSEVVDILEMYQLHTSGKTSFQQEALDWAMTHDKISKAIVFSVQDWIDYQIERLDRQQRPGKGI